MRFRTLAVTVALFAVAAACTPRPAAAAPPPSTGVTVMVQPSADTTVRYEVLCNAPTGQQIESCRWTITKGGAAVTVPNGFSAVVSHTGPPADSVQVVAKAETMRRGLFGTISEPVAFWIRIADAPPPGSTGITVRACTLPAPACNP